MTVPVGPYSNARWHYANNLSRPEAGTTWIPDRYLNTPNKANQPTPGERECGSDGDATSTGSNGSSNTHKSVFFSPNDTPTGQNGLNPGNINVAYRDWAGNGCSANKVANHVTSNVDTLAGWSVARLGPIYYLAQGSQEQLRRIHKVILFDPGNTNDFEGSKFMGVTYEPACDPNYDINAILKYWVQMDPANQLIIITGERTEERRNGRSTFAGLWKDYLADLWNTPVAVNHVKICDYKGMGHTDLIRNFAWEVKNTPGGCVNAPNGQTATSWHP